MTPTREYSSSRFPRPPFPTSRLEVLSRFEPHANGQSTSAVHFVPGGAWLVSLSNCRPNSLSKTDPIAAQITVWNLHSLASPRCTLKLIREDLNFDESALLVDRESGIATLALTSSQTLDERRTKLIVYRLPLLDEGSLTHPAEPEAVINDLWLPTHPSAGEEPGSAVMALELSKNVIASSIRDISQVDEDEQFNPKLPPGGTDQIYLLHTPTSKGRWLHPRFVESFCSARAFIRDDRLYLLGRTSTTYVVRGYAFEPELLFEGEEDRHLDLGDALLEYESPPLPDPAIPWGSSDSHTVFLDPSSHLSILDLRSWFGQGHLVWFPLRGRSASDPLPPSTVTKLESGVHLPTNGCFTPRWLGRDEARIFSWDDDSFDDDSFMRLKFATGDHSSGAIQLDGEYLAGDVGAEKYSSPNTRVIAVDVESRRMCVAGDKQIVIVRVRSE